MRMRFTKDERAAFTPGSKVEIRNGRFWYPAEVLGPIQQHDGAQSIRCQVTSVMGRRGTVRYADIWSAGPTSVRVPETITPDDALRYA